MPSPRSCDASPSGRHRRCLRHLARGLLPGPAWPLWRKRRRQISQARFGPQLVLRVDQISPNPNNPRRDFDEDSLNQLASSMQRDGQLQPVVVRRVGDTFQLICGERRWRAANGRLSRRSLQLSGTPRINRRTNWHWSKISIERISPTRKSHRSRPAGRTGACERTPTDSRRAGYEPRVAVSKALDAPGSGDFSSS